MGWGEPKREASRRAEARCSGLTPHSQSAYTDSCNSTHPSSWAWLFSRTSLSSMKTKW